MPSTYSPNLRLELIASGEQGNSWGNTTNTNIGTLLEQAISGYKALNTGWSGNSLTLTAYNGAVDDARAMFLEVPSGVSLSATGTITAPAKPKVYVIRNTSSGGQSVTITTGSGTTSTIPNGETKIVACDGTNFHDAVTSASSFSVSSAPSDGSDITNKTYVDAGDAARLKKDGSENMTGDLVLFNAGTPTTPGAAISNTYAAARYLPKDGSVAMTGPLTLTNAIPSGYQAVSKSYLDSLSFTGGTGITVNGSVASGTLSVALNPATAGTIGGVKPGSGFSVAADGTLTYSGSTGGITSVSVATANGFSGSSSGGSTPILTLGTSVNGIVQGNGSALSAATGSAIASALGSTAVTNAVNATYVGGYTASDLIKSSGSQSLTTTAPTTTTPGYFRVTNPTASSFSVESGVYYATSPATYLAYLGSYASSGSSTNRPPLIFLQRYGSSINPFMSSTVTGEVLINSLGAVNGPVYVNNGVLTTTNPSDARLKTNITDLTFGLKEIAALRPVSFTWATTASDPTKVSYGFIAQEVQRAIPELVSEYEHKEDPYAQDAAIRLGLNKEGIYVGLVAAIQELNAKIETLQAEVDALKGA